MKKQFLLYVLLVFLAVVNGFFVYHFSKEDDTKPTPPEEFIVKQLNFNDTQMQDFKRITDRHFDDKAIILEELKRLKKSLFSRVSDQSLSKPQSDSIGALIGRQETLKELEVFNHLKQVRALCNDEQKQHFSKIVSDALKQSAIRKLKQR